ncbi:MAG: Hpt domain-containing protein [Pelagibacterales bacterium]|nr:Hpt domain-containing protein [Pelagibacterales bacterium]
MDDILNKKAPIDVDFLRSVINDDPEFERELFKIFVENANRNIEKMEEAYDPSRYNFWYMASHAFKGSAASVGAFELSKILEHAQKSSEEPAEVKAEIVKQVKEEFAKVNKFINENLLR